jgi:hypothetical protein
MECSKGKKSMENPDVIIDVAISNKLPESIKERIRVRQKGFEAEVQQILSLKFSM